MSVRDSSPLAVEQAIQSQPVVEVGGPVAAIRRVDVDALRVLAVLVLVPFHAARVFNVGEPFYVKNEVVSWALSYFIWFVQYWHMPLFFVLAGSSTWFALGRRSGGEYLRERVLRLLLPLIFGVLVVVPPQGYIALASLGRSPGSYVSYYPTFFATTTDLTGYDGSFTPAHLWFILYLIEFSVVLLPAFLVLRREAARPILTRLGVACQNPVVLFAFALPLAVTGALPAFGGKNPFFYGLLFAYGFLLVADDAMPRAIDRNGRLALVLGGATMALALAIAIGRLDLRPFPWLGGAINVLETLNGWLWVLALLAVGRRLFTRSGPVLRYASEASYPFYILHQTVLVVIGFFIVQLAWPMAPKYLTIILMTTAATVLVYELAVRRVGVLRLAFGLKRR
jgi:surface polysaccharide O-acyltransferase-like enzyme